MTSFETESTYDGIISVMTRQLFFKEYVVHDKNMKQSLITAYIYIYCSLGMMKYCLAFNQDW